MCTHTQRLQYKSTPAKPDAVYARKLQELIGDQYGEITVAMQYSFQSWNAHIPGKYRDLLFGTAAEELREEGLEEMPVPSNFPQAKEATEFSYDYYNFSDGAHAADGSWASGPTPDGKGTFGYRAEPMEGAPMPPPTHPDARFYGTTEKSNRMEKAAGAIQDKLEKE